jgi:putative Holliday junction resolvase
MRILCLDIGDKRIGTALSDPLEILASPLGIIEREDYDTDFRCIVELVAQHKVGRVVVGMPVSLTGKISEQARKVMTFTVGLTPHLGVPLVFWNEGLSTVTARELYRQGHNRKNQEAPKHDDALAAAVILQEYLNDKRPPESPAPQGV